MAYLRQVEIKTADSPSIDGFGRFRVSSPDTLFDSKQLADNQPLFWDEEIVNNSGTTTSTHSSIDAASTMTVGALVGDFVVRQTKMRFNYQPGKSQQILMTFVLNNPAPNVLKRVGYFNSNGATPFDSNKDGLWLQQDGDGARFYQSKNGVVTGVAQQTNAGPNPQWNLDPMDGTGPSGINLDWTATQILIFDFEWLGVGRVRMGFVVNGLVYYAHEFLNGNAATTVYMSSPNHSCRYEIRSAGAAASMQHICCSVQSEGGRDDLGVFGYAELTTPIAGPLTAGTEYAVIGSQLKQSHLGTTVRFLNTNISVLGDEAVATWRLRINPTFAAGSLTYGSAGPDSSLEYAEGTGVETISGGKILAGGIISTPAGGQGGAPVSEIRELDNALRMGVAINDHANNRDKFVLTIEGQTAATINDIRASVFWRELL